MFHVEHSRFLWIVKRQLNARRGVYKGSMMKLIQGILLGMMTAMAASGSMTKASFGTAGDGTPVTIYTLKSDTVEARIMTYGARIVSIRTPDRAGKVADVVLGYDDVQGYLADTNYFGAIVGRYGNRLAKGKFSIGGHEYSVPVNNGVNALHGGPQGFSQKVWTGKEIPDGVELTLVSPDGDMGFPGTLTVHVRYTLHHGTLKIEYTATTDKPTVTNLTNHSYFNLSGEGTILGDEMQINADHYLPVDPTQIPTGVLQPVEGTAFDFRAPVAIGKRINDPDKQLQEAGGYDHAYALNGKDGAMKTAVVAFDPKSGRVLTVTTTQPSVQFYTGNSIPPGLKGKDGQVYGRNSAFCLETQHYPDAPNHPVFPSTLLKPGETLHTTTEFTFSVRK